MSFQSNKVPGYDKVPMSVIKDTLPCILPAQTDIVNNSLLSLVFPASCKISEVVPPPTDGNHELGSNSRPVSLLPAMSKICEWAALNQFNVAKYNLGEVKRETIETFSIRFFMGNRKPQNVT